MFKEFTFKDGDIELVNLTYVSRLYEQWGETILIIDGESRPIKGTYEEAKEMLI